MANGDEFRPGDWEEEEIKPGLYVWPVYLDWAKLKDTNTDKPYLLIGAQVEEYPKGNTANVGFKFDFRIYLSRKSKGWAMYFLKKFGYPEQLMQEGQAPIIRTAEIAGLHGKLMVEITITEMMFLKTDVKGFDHIDGDELEKKRDKTLADRQQAEGSHEEAPARDLEEDVKTSPVREPGDEDDPFSSFN